MKLEVRDGGRAVSLEFGVSEFATDGVGGFVRGMFFGTPFEKVIEEADGHKLGYLCGGGCGRGSFDLFGGKDSLGYEEGTSVVFDGRQGVGTSDVKVTSGLGCSACEGVYVGVPGDVEVSSGFVTGCVDEPFGVQGAKTSRARDFEEVIGCVPEGVQAIGVGGADCVAGFVSGVDAVDSPKVKVGKKKMGKNQRDRAKWAVEGSWRKPAVGSVSVVEKSELRASLEKKWAAQNELAAEKARKDLEYQRARDVDAEARTTRAKLLRVTEQSKVAVEKAFSTLKSTGNVPGFCETVVSSGDSVPGLSGGSSSAEGCTISPDSSASMHEFREAQKKVLDLEDKIRKMERAEKMRSTVGEIAITNDGDEPSPSLQEEMDRLDEKYNTQYVYEPAVIGKKNVLLLKCETFGDYCEGEDY